VHLRAIWKEISPAVLGVLGVFTVLFALTWISVMMPEARFVLWLALIAIVGTAAFLVRKRR
jgi:hypothetical protein